jgi:hypothetical protein
MGSRMELVAGDVQVILVVGTGDRDALSDPARFSAYLSLSGGMDPTWLDLFAEAARAATERDAPTDFIDARIELGAGESAPADGAELSIERVEPAWISAPLTWSASAGRPTGHPMSSSSGRSDD